MRGNAGRGEERNGAASKNSVEKKNKREDKETGVRSMEMALEAIASVTEDGKISLDFLSFEGNGVARGDRS